MSSSKKQKKGKWPKERTCEECGKLFLILRQQNKKRFCGEYRKSGCSRYHASIQTMSKRYGGISSKEVRKKLFQTLENRVNFLQNKYGIKIKITYEP